MVGASKILTVSYGTFSCTLEGFDDPFSTMRSIAEYFRDLAADDRYFGAEPPTPDAEMLHRIAEQEVQKRVEARVQDGGIVLRQMEADQSLAPVAPPAPEQVETEQDDIAAAPAPMPVSEDAAPATDMDEAGDWAAPQEADDHAADATIEPPAEMVADAEPAAEIPADAEPAADEAVSAPPTADDDSVAAKLSRIRAVVSRSRETQEEAEYFVEDEETATAPFPAYEDDTFDAAPYDSAPDEDTPAMAAEDDEQPADDDLPAQEAGITDIAARAETQEMSDPVDAVTDAADADIDDDTVPATAGFDAAEMETTEEPLHQADVAEDGVAEDEDTYEDEQEFDDTTLTPEDLAAINGAHAETEDDMDGELAAAEDAGTDQERADAAPSLAARIVKLKRSALDVETAFEDGDDIEAAAFDDAGDGFDGDDMAAPGIAAESDAPEAEQDFDFDDENIAGVGAEDAPVMSADSDEDDDLTDAEREFIAEFEDEFDGGEDEALAEEALADEIRSAIGETSLSDEDEADLADELAAVARADDEDAGASAAERLGELAEPREQDSDLDRILNETNTKMEDSESSRRRSAIAHLKAAVAATKADRLLKRMSTREETDAAEQSQYRDDLAKVVRPRRPAGEREAPSQRPTPVDESASPLMLVSELRVDEDGAADPAPTIKPRRVVTREIQDQAFAEAGDMPTPDDASSFAEFAEKMGASELPDLLEAAAVYSAFVEGQPHFSRPQLMKRVAKYDPQSDFSREAGLRSFGQLLRQGKIQKLKRGQFAIAQNTRFNPDARIAGE